MTKTKAAGESNAHFFDATRTALFLRTLVRDRSVTVQYVFMAPHLQRAVTRPVHAYLLVGPRGSGVEDAARAFAATLIAPDDARVGDLVRRGEHPDVVEIDPTGNQVVIADAQALVREAHASPIECDRKVLILSGADRLNDTARPSAEHPETRDLCP